MYILKKLLILFSSSKNTCWKILLLAIQHSWREYWFLKDPIKRLVYGGINASLHFDLTAL